MGVDAPLPSAGVALAENTWMTPVIVTVTAKRVLQQHVFLDNMQSAARTQRMRAVGIALPGDLLLMAQHVRNAPVVNSIASPVAPVRRVVV